MITNPRKLYSCHNVRHNKIGSAIVEIADNAVMECYITYGFDRGYQVGKSGYSEKLPEQVAYEEYFISKKGIISILFEDN